MIVLIDNYDSFAHNLARYLRRLAGDVVCLRHDATDAMAIQERDPELIVMSPGPGRPEQAGCCLDIVATLGSRIPMLGVCLGHQVIAQAFGGTIVRAKEPTHGMASPIEHDGTHEFRGLPNPLAAGRYHSLMVDGATLPDCFCVSAWTAPDSLTDSVSLGTEGAASGVLMAVRHVTLPIFGWQFHPESILTECGYALLANLLVDLGIPIREPIPTSDAEFVAVGGRDAPHPTQPITF